MGDERQEDLERADRIAGRLKRTGVAAAVSQPPDVSQRIGTPDSAQALSAGLETVALPKTAMWDTSINLTESRSSPSTRSTRRPPRLRTEAL